VEKIAIYLLMLLAFPFNIYAYKLKTTFDSGNNYYTGSTRSGSQTCAISSCHTGSSTSGSKFNLVPVDMPSDSDGAFVYSAGKGYTFNVSMISDNQSGGGNVNQNGFTLEILDSTKEPAGTITAMTGTILSSTPSQIIMDADSTSITSNWSFKWTAPQSTTGALSIYFAGVDGNGDGLASSADVTDAGIFTLKEESLVTSDGGGCSITAGNNQVYFGLASPLIVLMLFLAMSFRLLGYKHYRKN
jgi:hypothetical protein